MAEVPLSDKTLRLEIVSAQAQVYSGQAHMVSVQAVSGELGILPRHAPLMTFLVPGEVRIRTASGDEEFIYVDGGFLEVQPDVVTILADTAVRGGDIDEEAALKARRAAEEAMRTATLYSDRDLAQAELLKALAQLRTLEHTRRRGR
ncbi:MAG: F0F1 ATP synthase subunit epsilon [Gammaproteobacteria bacterium]|nr:F0F1 ATP synthase subunit epsilon [Gammaproteobacteria bacterium]